MPPRKTTSTSPQTRSNSRKRLSSQTDENQTENSEQDLETEQENQPQTPSLKNDDGPTNSSLNSDPDPVVEDEKDSEVEKPKPSKKAKTEPKLTVGGEPEGEIIRLGEDLKFSATKHKGFAVVDNDVYREFQLRGTKRIAFQLVYTAGTAIPLSKLNETK